MRQWLRQKKSIVTHSGSFHADDVFAVAVLTLWLDQRGYRWKIIRSRDPEIWEQGDYVIDVGGEYDHHDRKYDHHQKEGAGSHENGIPYASFGLIWDAYGHELVDSHEVWRDIDDTIVSSIDAYDNGVNTYSTNEYNIFPITIQNIIHWLDSSSDSDDQFIQAVNLARELMKNIILEKENEHYIQQGIIDFFDKNYQNSEDNRYIIFDEPVSRHMIWKALSDYPGAADLLYAVYNNGKHSQWNIVAMRENHDSFESRQPFPESWRGVDAQRLREVTGVDGAVFCHRSGFLCGAEMREDAETLAKKALH